MCAPDMFRIRFKSCANLDRLQQVWPGCPRVDDEYIMKSHPACLQIESSLFLPPECIRMTPLSVLAMSVAGTDLTSRLPACTSLASSGAQWHIPAGERIAVTPTRRPD